MTLVSPTPAPTPVVPATSTFATYAAALLPFFVLVIGASQTVLKDPTNVQGDVLFAIIVLGAVLSYIVKLIPSAVWQGRAKTGIAIITTVLAAVVPFLLPTGFAPATGWPIVAIAVLNALATELGVQIRVNDTPAPVSVVSSATTPATTPAA